jgi:hypothetical protein
MGIGEQRLDPSYGNSEFLRLKNKNILPSVTTEVDRPSAQQKQMQTTRGLQILVPRLTAREFFCFAVTLPVKKGIRITTWFVRQIDDP